MSKFYREEISYKRLYGEIDLEKDLNVNWEEMGVKPKEDLPEKKLEDNNEVEKEQYCVDTDDLDFIKEHNIAESTFVDQFENLNKKFYDYVAENFNKKVEVNEKNNYCDVCGYGDDDVRNKLRSCIGCCMSVHEECYGIEDNEDFWICKRCEECDFDAICEFCSKPNGLLKKTDFNEWIHVVCAVSNKTLSFINEKSREPVDTSKYVPIEGECVFCKEAGNTLMECSFKGCVNAFHVSCACNNLYMDIYNGVVYCDKHNPCKVGMPFKSRRKIEDIKTGYSKLKKEVFEREDKDLQPNNVCAFKEQLFGLLNKFVEENKTCDLQILEHWSKKFHKHGINYNNIYFIRNALNKE